MAVLGDLMPLTLALVAPAAQAGARAFMDDISTAYLIPDPAKRPNLRYAFEYYLKLSVLTHEEAYVTSPRCEGLTVWEPPAHKDSVLATLRAGWPFNIMKCGLTYLIRDYRIEHHFGRLRQELAPKPHMYLALLAVDPAYQGQGFASRLVRPMLARLDAEKLPAYLETQSLRNVAMYERFGFRLLREEPMPGAGFTLYLMLREPQGR